MGVAIRVAPLPCGLWALSALAGGVIVPAQLWLTKRLVDALAAHVAGRADHAGGWLLWLSLLVGLLILQQILSGLQQWVQVLAGEKVGPSVQEQVMRAAAKLDTVRFEHQEYYDQVARVLSETEGRAPGLVGGGIALLQSVPPLVGYVWAMAALSPIMLAFIAAGMVPSLIEAAVSGQKGWSLLHQQTRERRLAAYYAGILTDRHFAKEVRIYQLPQYVIQRWSELFWKASNETRHLSGRLRARSHLLSLFSTAASMAGLVWVVQAGLTQTTAGAYAILFQSITGMLHDMPRLILLVKDLATQSGFAGELRSFLSQSPQDTFLRGGSPGLKPLPRRAFPTPLSREIRFEDVWFTYPDAHRPVLAGVSFSIRAGETVALVGENGAGKTTLVKLLLGLYHPNRGRILFDGCPAEEIDLPSRFKAMSAVFQGFLRYCLTLRENIAASQIDLAQEDQRILSAAARAGLDGVIERLPQGLNTLLGPDVGGVELSGGEWQRVALARAFLRDSQVLILDEPTAALDPMAEVAIFERFAELARGQTTLLISHRLGMARLADRILVLENGRLVEDGSHEGLVQRGGPYARMFEAQARWYV
ncbi:MAG: ABC transporter ATP-binding protein [Limnochordaceae bacterium]|nr:ABC transporter ATP-binding protein [Limnochordaceae bacterium]